MGKEKKLEQKRVLLPSKTLFPSCTVKLTKGSRLTAKCLGYPSHGGRVVSLVQRLQVPCGILAPAGWSA